MRESELEKILVDEVRKEGGKAYKWISPGNDGVPDRIVFLPGGGVYFVELKTDTGVVSPKQKVQLKKLHDLGQKTCVVKGLGGMIIFFNDIGLRAAACRLSEKLEREEVMPDEVHTT